MIVPTFTLYKSLLESTLEPRLPSVSEVVMAAVKLETITRLFIMNRVATILPPNVFGALSPYPTVQRVTTEYQKPEPIPLIKRTAELIGIFLMFKQPENNPENHK